MNAVLWWLVQNTLTVALLIPCVAVACRICRNRPAVQHLLWAVVLLKFVTPPVVYWPGNVERFSLQLRSILTLPGSAGSIAWADRVGTDVTESSIRARQVDATAILQRPGAAVAPELAGKARFRPGFEVVGRAFLALLATGWLLGSTITTARQLRRIRRHALLIRLAKNAPVLLRREIDSVAMQVGLRPPRALVAGGIDSPFVWVFGRLCLVWPEKLAGFDEIVRSRSVIAHELAHVRRGDHLLAWVELVAGLLWWWNPLFWFVRNRVRESAELACDAIALSACSENRRAYAELLVQLSSGSAMPTLTPVLGIKAGSTASFERRLSMILSDRVSGRLPSWALIAAAALAIVSLPGLTLAQKSADTLVASTEQVAESARQNPTSTAARLEQIESELKRVCRMLEEAKRSAPDQKESVTARARRDPTARPKDSVARWNDLKVIDKHSTVMTFSGSSQNYLLTTDEQEAWLSALNRTNLVVWKSELPLPLGDSGEWSVKESSDQTQVVVVWAGKRELLSFTIAAASGSKILETRREPFGDLRSPVYSDPKRFPAEGHSPSVVDRLRALNATGSGHRKILERLKELEQSDDELTQSIFWNILHRDATRDELAHATKHLSTGFSRSSAVEDIFWVLINSREYQSSQEPRPGIR
jgi:beta-lactamase regulating signal transducer with metallopeptidase domain